MTDKMNPEIKTLWLSALRSGEYEQTTGVLHRGAADDSDAPGFCCLGVLCDLAVKNGVIPEPTFRDDKNALSYGTRPQCGIEGCEECMNGSIGLLPTEVREWAGMADASGNLPEKNTTLAELNDSGDYDFAGIADIIEEEF